MTFLFDSQSDSYRIDTRFSFPDWYMRSSQIRRWCRKFCFDILLAALKMITSSNVSAAYCDVYHISVMDPFIRWHQSPYPKAWFLFLFSGFASRNILVTYPWTSSYDRALDQVLEQSCPFISHFFLWNSEWRFSILPCRFASSMKLWESPPWILSWYLLFKAWVIYCLSESFRCCFWCSAFLLKLLKVDGIASLHFIAPHHGHHDYSIVYTSTHKCILILSKSVCTKYHLECDLITLSLSFVSIDLC
jgi:hypothetical protein